LPLAIANGAGSGSENAVGRGVIGGMLTATFLAPFLIPMFFFVITGKVFKPKDASSPAVPQIGAPGSLAGATPT
jgi:multidrug efflux pump